MSLKPKVSILCLTYNHKHYIKQALDSFLSQKTDFDFEVLINDDGSNDGTTDIIKEYRRQHPQIIRPIFHKQNLYSQGVRNMLVRFLFPKARGGYIALCEGDDYWTDDRKLQRQVDFLDKRPDYALCFHPVRVTTAGGESTVFPDRITKFTTKDLLERNFIQTNSVMYRRQSYNNMPTNVMPGDWYLHLYHAKFGKIGFINKVMATYRRHPGSMWWNSDKNTDDIWIKHGLAHLALFSEMLKLYGGKPEYQTIVNISIDKMMRTLIDVDAKHNSGLVWKALEDMPECVLGFLLRTDASLRAQELLVDQKSRQVAALQLALQKQGLVIAQKDREIKEIKSSRVWRLRNLFAKLTGQKNV